MAHVLQLVCRQRDRHSVGKVYALGHVDKVPDYTEIGEVYMTTPFPRVLSFEGLCLILVVLSLSLTLSIWLSVYLFSYLSPSPFILFPSF